MHRNSMLLRRLDPLLVTLRWRSPFFTVLNADANASKRGEYFGVFRPLFSAQPTALDALRRALGEGGSKKASATLLVIRCLFLC